VELLFFFSSLCPGFRNRGLKGRLASRVTGGMKNRDLVSSAVCIFVGGLFVAGSLYNGLMRRGVPGPGFVPFFSGLALVFVSLFVLIPALAKREKAKSAEEFFPERNSFRKILFALVGLIAFGAALKHAGYLLTTFFFMFFVTWIMEPKRWGASGVLALFAAILSYLLFVVLLGVELPKGFLGF
jgi:putative tricarboxylic transport membrane protein